MNMIRTKPLPVLTRYCSFPSPLLFRFGWFLLCLALFLSFWYLQTGSRLHAPILVLEHVKGIEKDIETQNRIRLCIFCR